MDQMAGDRLRLFQNLAAHAALTRAKMGLSLSDAARLFGIEQNIIEKIERREDCDLPIKVLLRLAQGLGLTDVGLPREKPNGSV
ncbi:hypothetical protein ACFZ8E_26595 [Methylobacterium sp. HMF5984]|uniref:hypothetical protein n=1 Tax=Methylobacterium sp. HMF5984 TaxID=3367370 RepID=UPI00385331E6